MRYTSPAPLSDTIGSNLLAQSYVVAAPSSPYGVNKNDLVLSNYSGQAFPVKSTSFIGASSGTGGANAGNYLVADTATGGTGGETNDVKRTLFYDEQEGSVFVINTAQSASVGVELSKYSNTGVLLGSVSFDLALTVASMSLLPLSDGNLAMIWGASGNSQNFAIITRALQTVVGKTTFGAAPTGMPAISATELSGGGFAVSYVTSTTTAAFFAIYSNSGAVVSAPAAIAGSPTANVKTRVAQLSSANIVVAITSTQANQALSRVQFNLVGAVIAALTVTDTATKADSTIPEVSVVTGFFAIAANVNSTAKVFVYNNANSLQGSAFQLATGGNANPVRLRPDPNDSTRFWFVQTSAGNTSDVVTCIPTTGTGYVSSSFPSQFGTGTQSIDFVIELGSIVLVNGANNPIRTYKIAADKTLQFISTFNSTTTYGSPTVISVGDFALMVNSPTSATFAILRWLNIAIIGVSRNTVAPGSSPLIQIAAGPVGMQINPLPGVTSKNFNHSAASIAGNNGIVWNNSAILKGF